jgi:hypothetical protein
VGDLSWGRDVKGIQPHTTPHRGFLATYFVKVRWYLWPRGTVISQLPSAVTSTVDHPLGSSSLVTRTSEEGAHSPSWPKGLTRTWYDSSSSSFPQGVEKLLCLLLRPKQRPRDAEGGNGNTEGLRGGGGGSTRKGAPAGGVRVHSRPLYWQTAADSAGSAID